VLIQKSALEDPNFCLTPILSEMLAIPHIGVVFSGKKSNEPSAHVLMYWRRGKLYKYQTHGKRIRVNVILITAE
jgi:hypothetical protein